MSFDKFKKLLPKPVAQPENTDEYFKELANLQESKPKSKVLPIVSGIAAAVAIVAVVSLWAIIGAGVRNGGVTVPADKYENVEMHEIEMTEKLSVKIRQFCLDHHLFVPDFDKDNPLDKDIIIQLCEFHEEDLRRDLILSKEELYDFAYNLFRYKIKFKDIKYEEFQPSPMIDAAAWIPISYNVSDKFSDGTSVVQVVFELDVPRAKDKKTIRYVQNGEFKFEYLLSSHTEEYVETDPYYAVKYNESITDELYTKIENVFLKGHLINFLPVFDRDDPPTKEELENFCAWTLNGTGENNIITKKQLHDYVYDTFNIEVDFENDIESKKSRLALMDMTTYHPVQYMVSKPLPDGTRAVMLTFACDTDVKEVRFVQKDDLEIQYFMKVSTGDPITPILNKDHSIKISKRCEIFDLVADYRIDAMPEFSEGETPDIEDMKWYAVHLNVDKIDKENSTISSKIFNKVAKEKFMLEYDLNGQKELSIPAADINDFPLGEIIRYSYDGVKVTATVAIYNLSYVREYNCRELYPSEYEYAKRTVTQGLENTEEITSIVEFSYTTKDGKTPDKFISLKRYTKEKAEFSTFFK